MYLQYCIHIYLYYVPEKQLLYLGNKFCGLAHFLRFLISQCTYLHQTTLLMCPSLAIEFDDKRRAQKIYSPIILISPFLSKLYPLTLFYLPITYMFINYGYPVDPC